MTWESPLMHVGMQLAERVCILVAYLQGAYNFHCLINEEIRKKLTFYFKFKAKR